MPLVGAYHFPLRGQGMGPAHWLREVCWRLVDCRLHGAKAYCDTYYGMCMGGMARAYGAGVGCSEWRVRGAFRDGDRCSASWARGWPADSASLMLIPYLRLRTGAGLWVLLLQVCDGVYGGRGSVERTQAAPCCSTKTPLRATHVSHEHCCKDVSVSATIRTALLAVFSKKSP